MKMRNLALLAPTLCIILASCAGMFEPPIPDPVTDRANYEAYNELLRRGDTPQNMAWQLSNGMSYAKQLALTKKNTERDGMKFDDWVATVMKMGYTRHQAVYHFWEGDYTLASIRTSGESPEYLTQQERYRDQQQSASYQRQAQRTNNQNWNRLTTGNPFAGPFNPW